MSYLPQNPAILPDGQEVKVHGSEAFPFAVYWTDRRKWSTMIQQQPLKGGFARSMLCSVTGKAMCIRLRAKRAISRQKSQVIPVENSNTISSETEEERKPTR